MTYDGTKYYYILNLQGDVFAIINASSGIEAEYEYDAWGYIRSVEDVNGIGAVNPLRYRGYYYDEETGFYYLNSRYYDPEIGRFINADGYVSTGQGFLGYNMFAYCENNSVLRKDRNGTLWDYATDVGFWVWSFSDVVKEPGNLKNWAALAVDTAFAVIPFVPSGAGQIIKYGNKVDNAADVATGIKKVAKISDVNKTTMIGRNMNRVVETAKIIGVADNLYKTWSGYNKVADVSKIVANSISAAHNGSWLLGQLRKGYTVIDIGVSTAHNGRGLWYGTERIVLGLWNTRNIWKLPINYFSE